MFLYYNLSYLANYRWWNVSVVALKQIKLRKWNTKKLNLLTSVPT